MIEITILISGWLIVLWYTIEWFERSTYTIKF